MQSTSIASENHYMRLSMIPASKNELSIRKTIADALGQSFGLISTATYLDVLWVSEDGGECVIRVHRGDAMKISAALASWRDAPPRLSLMKESPFLPSLLCKEMAL